LIEINLIILILFLSSIWDGLPINRKVNEEEDEDEEEDDEEEDEEEEPVVVKKPRSKKRRTATKDEDLEDIDVEDI